MISLPEKFLKRVDRLAKRLDRSRSELIRESLRGLLEKNSSKGGSWKARLAPLCELEAHWVGQWDSTDIIRYYRNHRYGREDRR